MRAHEFINESSKLRKSAKHAIPGMTINPGLDNNNNPYLAYRFGVALAGAKGAEQRKEDAVPEFDKETPWGENLIIVSYAGKDPLEKYLDDALREVGLVPSDAKLLTTEKSEEPTDTGTKSTLPPFKGYKK